MEDYDGVTFTFANDIITNNNGDDGIELLRFKNGSGAGADLLFDNPQISANIGFGIVVNEFDGNVTFLDSQLTGNIGGGIQLVNVKNTAAGTRTFIGTSLGGTSNILFNGIGGGAGIDVLLNQAGATQNLVVTNTTIGGQHDGDTIIVPAGFGIRAIADGLGATLNTSIVDNLAISYHNSEGIRLVSLNGAVHNATILNNAAPLVMDGNGLAGAGNNINLIAGGTAGGVLAELNVLVQNISTNATLDLAGNVIAPGVGGSWLVGSSTEDGVIRATVQQVTADTITGTAVALNFDNLGNGAAGDRINSFTLINNTFTNIAGNGVVLTTGDDTHSDVLIANNTLTSTTTAPLNTGITVTTNAAGGGPVDNLTRVTIQNNIVSQFDANGMTIAANDDSHLLLRIEGNTVAGNGAGFRDTTVLPFLDGINISGNDASRIDARIINNLITGSADIGLQISQNGTGQMNLLLDSNAATGNDFGEDPADDPIINANFIQMQIVNFGAGGDLCLAMTNNFYNGAGILLGNLGVPADFTFENNGDNSPGIATVGALTPAAFGSTCEPAIATQETAFETAGFPPR